MWSYSKSFLRVSRLDLVTVIHASGVAGPCRVTTYAASVVWSSFSKSVQSSAMTTSLRSAMKNRAQEGVSAATSIAREGFALRHSVARLRPRNLGVTLANRVDAQRRRAKHAGHAIRDRENP